VASECILHPDVCPFRPFLVGGVDSDIANQQVRQAVVVVVEEKSTGRVGGEVNARFARNILEVLLAVVLEENVAFVNSGNEEILVAGIVYVAESGGNADAIFQTDAGSLGNVLKFSVAEIAPEFIAAKLIWK
jgi:hypothetical protein